MGFDTKSDFAINKKTKDIIYLFANNDSTRLELKDGMVYEHFTCAKDSANNYTQVSKTMTAEKFDELKAFSNGNYHKEDNEQSEYNRQTACIHALEETLVISTHSHEDEVIARTDEPIPEIKDYRTVENAMEILDKLLTTTQKRRYIANVKYGKSTHQIARIEEVAQRSVYESIEGANKKIKKFLENKQKHPLKTPKKTR